MKVSENGEVVAFTRAEHDNTLETAEVEQISDDEAAVQDADTEE